MAAPDKHEDFEKACIDRRLGKWGVAEISIFDLQHQVMHPCINLRKRLRSDQNRRPDHRGKQLQLFCAQLAEIRLKDNAFSVLGSEELMQDPGADD